MNYQHRSKYIASLLAGTAFAFVIGRANAEDFNISGGTLAAALDRYAAATGVDIVVSAEALKGVRTNGVIGSMSRDEALSRLLRGTGFVAQREDEAIAVVRSVSPQSELVPVNPGLLQIAQALPSRAAVETVTVTSSKLGGGDVQSIPISITALSQEQLTSTQTAGGPDLVKQVPNLTFTKTNFTGYSINIRGIGTQAISVTTDPAVAVALNDQPFIRNHFFEQEFYDLAQVEVLRGPQGTLYGRNATAGVVNLTTPKPSDQFEAMASAEVGNYHQRRFEGMLNLPIVDDRLDFRIAGEWTKRQGYSFNALTNSRTDGRNLWSGRITLGIKPAANLQANVMWEHFSEDDDRIRSSKQLCKNAPTPTEIDGTQIQTAEQRGNLTGGGVALFASQGCEPASLYSPSAYQVPNGFALPFISALEAVTDHLSPGANPYAAAMQSQNLRVIESTINPAYKAKNDVVEMNIDYQPTSELTFTSQTAFSHDFLYSTQDYNRFNTAPLYISSQPAIDTVTTPSGNFLPNSDVPTANFCDPQLGCSDRLVGQDLSVEHSWQLSQEVRLSSNLRGPLNFSLGGNYLHYETAEDYYVFINALTLYEATRHFNGALSQFNQGPWIPGVSDNSQCMASGLVNPDPFDPQRRVLNLYSICAYIDPNPISKLNGNGHNYFRSDNPYTLNSYAAFGEAYYEVSADLKLTAGLRWTEDQKHFTLIPSELLVDGWGYPSIGTVDQQWDQFTGRFATNWTPKLSFTDQTLIYGSYAHGYKAGGANPPGAILITFNSSDISNPVHPLTFKPEFVDAFEIGSKNTLLDGSLTLNGSAFYYNYENYQISEIVDRTAINLNFDAHVKGAELEANWEPIPGLRFNFGGGWEDTALAKGSKAVDLIDRADLANHPDWMVYKPYVTQASNCVLPTYVVAALEQVVFGNGGPAQIACGTAYGQHLDPLTLLSYTENPSVVNPNYYVGVPIPYPLPAGYPGFDPATAPNNGQGFDKDLSGNELPNAPHFTVSVGAQYTIPLSSDWAGTLRSDFYWQDDSWARVFNDSPYDRLRGYTNFNVALIFTSQNGWQVMLYDKNVFNTTAITGTFLNSDDSGLTTNVFATDPKLIGIRVSKNW